MNITEFLKSFKANAESISNLEAEKAKLEGDFKTQAELVTSLQTENANHSEALATALADVKSRDTKISELELSISDFEKAINIHKEEKIVAAEEAVKIVKSIGIEPVAITKLGSDQDKSKKSAEEIKAEFDSIKDTDEKSKFYIAHRTELMSLLNK
jgi:chromosome segregation ATPase